MTEVLTKSMALRLGKSRYFSGLPCKHGHISQRNVANNQCIECSRISSRKSRKAWKEKHGMSLGWAWKTRTAGRRGNSPLYWCKEMMSSWRRRARKKGLDFNLTWKDVAEVCPTHCPVYGKELDYSLHSPDNPKRVDYETSPSLDRIDNSLGYVKDNIQVISYKANATKNTASIDDLKKLLKYLESLPNAT